MITLVAAVARNGCIGKDGALPWRIPEDMQRYRAAWRQQGALTAMVNWYRAVRVPPAAPLRERVRAPVRVIWGDRDRFLESGLVEASLSACDRGEAFHLPEATHWVQYEEPERVNRLLMEFLLAGGSKPEPPE